MPKPISSHTISSHHRPSWGGKPHSTNIGRPSATALQFSGALATQRCQDKFLKGDTLTQLLAQDVDPYVGSIPRTLSKEWHLNQQDALETLDQLAAATRQQASRHDLPASPPSPLPLEPLPSPLKQKLPPEFGVSYLGSGDYGRAYLLDSGKEKDVLKVFKRREEILNPLLDLDETVPFETLPPQLQNHALAKEVTQKPADEAAAGLYLTHHNVQDVAHLHAANPKAGWLLMEYIGPHTKKEERPGKSIEQEGFVNLDPKQDNYIQGILVDLGGISPRHAPLHQNDFPPLASPRLRPIKVQRASLESEHPSLGTPAQTAPATRMASRFRQPANAASKPGPADEESTFVNPFI